MPSSRSLSPAGILAEVAGLCFLFGLLHAIAETTFLGLSGIRLAALDLAILVLITAGATAMLAIPLALGATAPMLRKIPGATRGPHSIRLLVWTILSAIYFLVFLRIVYYWSGWGVLLWAFTAAPALIAGRLAIARKGHSAFVTVFATALVAAGLCAPQIVHAEWGNNPETFGVLSAWLLKVAGVYLMAMIALFVVRKRVSPGPKFEGVSRMFTPLAVVAALWAGFWISPPLPAGLFGDENTVDTERAHPNFLLIVLDTVRADHLDLFGYDRETMPNLRRFAEQECQFSGRMHAVAPWTVPSHASMFTGLYSSAHGAHHPFVHDPTPPTMSYSLREDQVTLAQLLDSVGYRTAGIAANFGALSAAGLSRGFAEFDTRAGSTERVRELLWIDRFQPSGTTTRIRFLAERLPDAVQSRTILFRLREPPYRRAREITDEAKEWLNRNGRRPFFLFLNYFDAHFPYVPLPQDDERFAPRPPAAEWRGVPTERYLARKRGVGKFSDAEAAFLIGQYDAELVGMDREFGRLADFLREQGYLENTVILVTSDHGESLFEHGLIDHGNSLYQPEIGGFLLVKTPVSLGSVEPSPYMQFVDFLPTFLTILGEPVPPEVQGSAWGAGRDYALSELFAKPGAVHNPEDWPDRFRRDRVAVIIDDKKLIRSSHDPDEIYDIAADPAELHPVAEPDPAFLQRSGQVITERGKRLVKDLSASPDDKQLLDKLRSLGYIQ